MFRAALALLLALLALAGPVRRLVRQQRRRERLGPDCPDERPQGLLDPNHHTQSQGSSDVVRRIVRFAELEAGWDSYDAVTIDPEQITRAARFVRKIAALGLDAPYAFPSLLGGVQLEWSSGFKVGETPEFELEAEFEPGRVELSCLAYEGPSDMLEFSATTEQMVVIVAMLMDAPHEERRLAAWAELRKYAEAQVDDFDAMVANAAAVIASGPHEWTDEGLAALVADEQAHDV